MLANASFFSSAMCWKIPLLLPEHVFLCRLSRMMLPFSLTCQFGDNVLVGSFILLHPYWLHLTSICRKHCVQSYNVFDFLREVVSKVPDYGHSDAAGEMPKRRLGSFLVCLITLKLVVFLLFSWLFDLHFQGDKLCKIIYCFIRKVAMEEHHDSEDEFKRSRTVRKPLLTLLV